MASLHSHENLQGFDGVCHCPPYSRHHDGSDLACSEFLLYLVHHMYGSFSDFIQGLIWAFRKIEVVGTVFLLVCLLTTFSFTCDEHLSEEIEGLVEEFQYWMRSIWKCRPAGNTIVVAKNGSGDFVYIQQAVNVVPNWNKRRITILICNGIYREKVFIPKEKEKITFLGEGNGTIIEWNNTASDYGRDGFPLKTYHSATVAVNAKYFVAKNVIFKNTALPPVMGQEGGQAVALRVSADKAAFYNCTFLGHQDTLYDHKGRHYFKNCSIKGNIDFIFGNGRSLYQECRLVIASTRESMGILTAQSRNTTTLDTGFSFVRCMISGDSGKNYLGRAWGTHSRVVFSYTWMDDVIIPEGWDDWGSPDRKKSVFYGQYRCFGPGSNTSLRVSWSRELSPDEVQPFLTIDFIDGREWLEEI